MSQKQNKVWDFSTIDIVVFSIYAILILSIGLYASTVLAKSKVRRIIFSWKSRPGGQLDILLRYISADSS